jgi:hypothetical protein
MYLDPFMTEYPMEPDSDHDTPAPKETPAKGFVTNCREILGFVMVGGIILGLVEHFDNKRAHGALVKDVQAIRERQAELERQVLKQAEQKKAPRLPDAR